ncbi:UDP-glucuronosyl UDP-glucosyltransferase [Colletotrichum graminicola]|nr:UDP-glucuronosyl UDP-glucosyltransferase [Colletotrichum graminicola]
MICRGPLPKGYTTRPPVINANVFTVAAAGIDTGPFGPGLLPRLDRVRSCPNFPYPAWWSDITAGTKKIVGVTQGTVAMEYTDLIIPTLQGLAHRDDILVVAILGAKGATLPQEFAVPVNARVIDYIPYDALRKHADPEVAMRGQWAGVAYNLRTGSPTPQQVADGVEEILVNDRYKKRVMEVKKESDELKIMDIVKEHIWEYAESS